MTQPIPTEMWASLEPRRALAVRDIPTVYRLLTKTGITQRRIAALTGQRQSEVSEIIKGRQVQSVAGSATATRLGSAVRAQAERRPTPRREGRRGDAVAHGTLGRLGVWSQGEFCASVSAPRVPALAVSPLTLRVLSGDHFLSGRVGQPLRRLMSRQMMPNFMRRQMMWASKPIQMRVMPAFIADVVGGGAIGELTYRSMIPPNIHSTAMKTSIMDRVTK